MREKGNNHCCRKKKLNQKKRARVDSEPDYSELKPLSKKNTSADRVVELLKELYGAAQERDPNSRGFSEEEFRSKTSEEKIEFLYRTNVGFFGREGMDRCLIEEGFLRRGIADEYFVASEGLVRALKSVESESPRIWVPGQD